MINELQIRNFKSHKKTGIKFSSGVNIIVGESDSGKSAIINALRWVIFNRPIGDSFRSNWGGTTKVSIETDDYKISRIKKPNLNAYSLNGKGERFVFKAIKSTVPEEISKVLNMDESNLQFQFDSHFLLSKSSGEVAQHFNKIANLDKIDLGVFFLSKEIRSAGVNLTLIESQLDDAIQELDGFINIKDIEHKIKAVEKQQNKLQSFNKIIYNVERILEDVEDVDLKIKKASKVLKIEKNVNNLLELLDATNKKELQLSKLKFEIEKYESLIVEETKYKTILKSEKTFNQLIEKYKLVKVKRTDIYNIEQEIDNINGFDLQIKKLEKERKNDLKSFNSKMGEVCVLCGAKVIHYHA